MGCLKNLFITAVGDIGPGKGNEQLKKWVEANSGRWQRRVTKGVTHLICSIDAYKKNVDAVQQAKELGVFIVSYDWLEDSLCARRKLPERKYTWEVLRKQRRNKKEMKRLAPKSDTVRFQKGCDMAREELGSGTPRKSGFFVSALEDLEKKREARKAEEKTKLASTAAATTTPEDAQRRVSQDAAAAFHQSATPKPTAPSRSMPQPKPQSHPTPQLQSPPQANLPASQPTPSLFPPCLNYTPPTPAPLELAQPHPTPPSSSSPATSKAAVPEEPKITKFTDLYHVYCDATGFHYNIFLLRQNPYLNNFAKYTLKLYESHTKPHVYATAVRYTPPAGGHASTSDDFADILGKQTAMQKTENLAAAATNAIAPQDLTTSEPTPTFQHNTKSARNPSTTAAAAAEKARLTALIAPLTPSPTSAYNSLPAPPNSTFAAALLAFRHIFRDLTLLTWEERLTPPPTSPSSLQRLRAQAFQIEPFIWRRPAEGLPVGRMPVIPLALGDIDTSYARNRWGLPGLDEPLGSEGAVGSAILREAQEAVRNAEQARLKAEEAVRKRQGGVKKPLKPNYKRPLFNGVNGRPVKDEYGRYFKYGTPGSSQSQSPAPVSAARAENVGGMGSARRDGRAVFTQFPVSKKDWRRSSFFTDKE